MYRVYLSTFGKKCIHVRDSFPIEVGSFGRSNFVYPLRDSVGVNIAYENEYYGELTGLYWIWKNVTISDDDIIGFGHYNKFLKISKRKAIQWLQCNKSGVIVLEPSFAKVHEPTDEVSAIKKALKESSEKDYKAWCKLYDERAASINKNCYTCNIFVAKGKTFKEYCSWLFSVLRKMREDVGDKPEVVKNERRYCAFIGERLMSVYVESHHLPVLCVGIYQKKGWLKHAVMLSQVLHIKKTSWLYRTLSKKLGNHSSYSK